MIEPIDLAEYTRRSLAEMRALLNKRPGGLASAMEERVAVPVPPACVLDYRDRHKGSKRGARRPWSQITGITLHQTACLYLRDEETRPAKIDRARERVAKIGVHLVALRDGSVVWSNPLDVCMPQAQRYFNRTDIGIEIDGHYSGIEGDPRTFWKPLLRPFRKPLGLSAAQVSGVLAACDWLVAEVAAHGGRIRYVHAHRQTSKSRTSDPGELLWKAVALPLRERHGLSDGGDGWYVPAKLQRMGDCWADKGPGRPIPREWDPRRTVAYRDQPTHPHAQEPA